MRKTLKFAGLWILSAALNSGCASTNTEAGSWMEAPGKSAKPASNEAPTNSETGSPLSVARDRIQAANDLIINKFPSGEPAAIRLWVADSQNLVDGIYTANFGDKLSPAPGIKMHKIMAGSNILIFDPLHVPPCTGMEDSRAAHWVIRTYITNYDENLGRSVKGFFPNADTSDVQAEIDNGTRTITDRFGLKAKITDCRSGHIIHGAEESFIKTAASRDKSVYLFGKSLGLFYRNSKFVDPGLNQTRDLAMDMFLAEMAMDIAVANSKEAE